MPASRKPKRTSPYNLATVRYLFFLLMIITFGSSPLYAESGIPFKKAPALHPLAGKILEARSGGFISSAQLDRKIMGARFVLLGEIHDNPVHHQLQARIGDVAARSDMTRAGMAMVFEMVPASLQPVLDKWQRQPGLDLKALGQELNWEKRGWPAFEIYLPVFKIAFQHKMRLLAGDMDRQELRSIGRLGIKAIPAGRIEQLFLDQPYSQSMIRELDELLYQSHCKLVPRSALHPMRLVQQARDGAMARAMIQAAGKSVKVILIAGAGHIRNDWGVPRLLRKASPRAGIVTIAFTEVFPGQADPVSYLPRGTGKRPVYDYLYFTPRANNEDHCAGLAKRFKKKKKNN